MLVCLLLDQSAMCFYNLCYEPWSRKRIKCFDSKVRNIVFLESIQNFNMFQHAEIAPQ